MSDTTLNDLFAVEETELSAAMSEQLQASEGLASVRDRISEEIDATEVSHATRDEILATVGQDVMKKLVELLDIDLVDIMFKVWNESGILERYLDPVKYDPNETLIVPIGEHTIESAHHPFVELLVNDTSVGKITFEVNVAMTLNGLVLKIQDAKIKELKTGTCSGSGSIHYGPLAIAQAQTREISLPGVIDLGEGVPIAP